MIFVKKYRTVIQGSHFCLFFCTFRTIEQKSCSIVVQTTFVQNLRKILQNTCLSADITDH